MLGKPPQSSLAPARAAENAKKNGSCPDWSVIRPELMVEVSRHIGTVPQSLFTIF
jgi:hypothetical protein